MATEPPGDSTADNRVLPAPGEPEADEAEVARVVAEVEARLGLRTAPVVNGSACSDSEQVTECPADHSAAWPQLDQAAYHGLAGEVVRALDPHTEADPVALLVTFLVAFGAGVGRGPHALADGAEHPARLAAVIVGQTAKARKGSSWVNMRRVLHAAEPAFFLERVLGGFGSGEALADALKDASERRLLVLETEFARILNIGRREGATLSPILRDAWDGSRIQVRSRAGTVVVDGAHVCALGHITAEELRAKLTETEVASGFVNRHLLVCARRSKSLPAGGNLDEQTVDKLGHKVHRAMFTAREVGILRRTARAEERWTEVYHAMDDDEPGGLLAAVTARDAAQTLRLSVSYALLAGAHIIDIEHVEAAWALWRYCRASAAFIFGDALGDEVADKLLRAIRQAGVAGLDGTQQRDLFGRHESAKRLEAVRRRLEKEGRIVTMSETTGGRSRLVSRSVPLVAAAGCGRSPTCDRSDQSDQSPATEGLTGGLRSPRSLSSHNGKATR